MPLLIKLNDKNLVLTGKTALLLHGLNMNSTPNDLDVVIYQPNEVQIKLLNDLMPLSEFNITSTNENSDGEYGNQADDIKIVKFKKNGFTIDIFTLKTHKPETNLIFKFDGIEFFVSGVNDVVKAKSSYCNEKVNSLGFNVKYNRSKDVLDLQDLKNSNFNI